MHYLQLDTYLVSKTTYTTNLQCQHPESLDQVPCSSILLFFVHQIGARPQQTASVSSDAAKKHNSDLHTKPLNFLDLEYSTLANYTD